MARNLSIDFAEVTEKINTPDSVYFMLLLILARFSITEIIGLAKKILTPLSLSEL
jgi:hypothetical protein